MRRGGAWATRFGIYLAAIGSAFGLGSLWRFPFIVEDNGGGAFVILYFFLVMLIGVPLLIGELLIGKVTRRGVLSAQRQLSAQSQVLHSDKKNRFLIRAMPLMAAASLAVAVLILGYYSVVSGWVLHFLLQFVGLPFSQTQNGLPVDMTQLMASAPRQISLTVIHLTLIFLVVAKGVEDGIEKWVGLIMPIFVGILFVLVFKSLSLESSAQALRFFLYPDFSKLSLASLGAAVGQLCFTLSVGFATMITFGSYLRDQALVPRTGFRVATMDSLTALIAGLLIFPLVVSSPMNSRGPVLLFETVPEFLLHIDGGLVFALFFFLCLYLAALGASISILETLVANVCENSNLKRGTATLITVLVAGVAALFPALSSTLFADVQWGGRGLLEIIDAVLINWILPVLALMFSQVVVYEVSENIKRNEFLALQGASSKILFDHWRVLMKWIVPAIIILGLVLQAIGIFRG